MSSAPITELSDAFLFSFTHPVSNGFAPPILGRDIGITFEEIQVALNDELMDSRVGLTVDEQSISECMSKLKLLNPIQQQGQKRNIEEVIRSDESEPFNITSDDDEDVMDETDNLLNGGR